MSCLRTARFNRGSRQRPLLWLVLLVIAGVEFATCDRHSNPQATFEHARQTFIHGDLVRSQEEAEQGYRRFSHSSPEWAWKFRILQAQSLLWRGRYPEVLTLLDSGTLASAPTEAAISILTLRGIAHGRQLDLASATRELPEAEQLSTPPEPTSCGEALQGPGIFSLGQT